MDTRQIMSRSPCALSKLTTNKAATPIADNNGEWIYYYLSFITAVTKQVYWNDDHDIIMYTTYESP